MATAAELQKQVAASRPATARADIAYTEMLGARKKVHYVKDVCAHISSHWHAEIGVCVFINAGPSTKLLAWGGGGIWEDLCYERRRA
jgi:hypothetical protein